ncbi:hypothetical protein [Yeosuana marina]|uniref:hypothetical protein n=1 Tax=Yeosuana marina TaxID=1565536 RepID=UPI0030C7FF2D
MQKLLGEISNKNGSIEGETLSHFWSSITVFEFEVYSPGFNSPITNLEYSWIPRLANCMLSACVFFVTQVTARLCKANYLNPQINDTYGSY